MFARFDENPAMTLRVIKETKRYGRTDARTDAHTDGRENSIPPTKFAGGIITSCLPKLPIQTEQTLLIRVFPIYNSYKHFVNSCPGNPHSI